MLETVEEDTRDEHVKTVYAHFGLAIYLAQCLEYGLANALIYLELIPKRAKSVGSSEEWSGLVDLFLDQKFEQTLGRLIRNLQAVTSEPTGLETRLAAALKKRNFLAHHYFRARAEDFMSEKGRGRMIAELEGAQDLIHRAEMELEAAVKPVRERYGHTDERLEAVYNEMLAEVEHDL